MSFGELKRFTAWSFSRWTEYMLCPLKARLHHLDKIPEPSNIYLEHGTEVHDTIAKYLRHGTKTLPSHMTFPTFAVLLTSLRNTKTNIYIEEMWSFTKAWAPCEWNDWKDVWARVKLDCAKYKKSTKTMFIFDWKTGKFKPTEAAEDYHMQLELYALAAFLKFPEVQEVRASLIYLEALNTYNLTFTRMDLPALKQKWEERTQFMLTDTAFAARPNSKCRFCHYRASNKINGGGQCVHG